MSIADRDNIRLVWCDTCPPESVFHKIMVGNMRAHNKARKHAKSYPEHTVIVVDLVKLEEEHRYNFVPLPRTDEPPF